MLNSLHFRIVCYCCLSKRKEIKLMNNIKLISFVHGCTPLPDWLYLAICLIENIPVVLYLAICENFF